MSTAGPPKKRNRDEEDGGTTATIRNRSKPWQETASFHIGQGRREAARRRNNKCRETTENGEVEAEVRIAPTKQAWPEIAPHRDMVQDHEKEKDTRLQKTRDYLEEERDGAARDTFTEGEKR